MFGQWLEEHKDSVLDIYVGLRQERGDPRPAEAIRLAAGGGFDIISQGFQGEAQWQDSAKATRHLLSAGIPIELLPESSYLFFTAIRQILTDEQPAPGGDEWLGELGEGLLRINQAMTLALGDTLQEQKNEFEALYRISRDLNMAGGKDELLQVLARPAIKAGAARATLLYIELDEAGEPAWAEVAATWTRVAEPSPPIGSRYYLPEFLFARLWLSSQSEPQIVANVNTDERMDENTRGLLAQTGNQAVVIVPLTQAGLYRETSAERRWVGIIRFGWDEPREFGAQEKETYKALIGLAASAVENRRLMDNLERMVEERTRELHAAETRYLQIVNDALVGIFHNTVDGQVIESNPAFLKFFGVDSVEEFNEIGLVNFYVDPSRRQDLMQVLQEQGRVTGFEAAYRRKDGSIFQAALTARLVADEQGRLTRLEGTLEDITQRVQAEAEQERLQQELIQAQQQAIQELSTPVIPIMERILVMPLVGSIDSMRARYIMRALLAGIREHRARIIILDITGVPIVDSGVANHLNKTIQAARLKGAQTIVTGVSDAVAEAIVDLGIDWSALETLGTLQTGLIVALDKLGIKLSKV